MGEIHTSQHFLGNTALTVVRWLPGSLALLQLLPQSHTVNNKTEKV